MHYLQLISYRSIHRNNVLRESALKRNPSQRISWLNYSGNMNDVYFRRRFRMHKECFANLVNVIKSEVGELEFKSESFLERVLEEETQYKHMLKAQQDTCGGYICGEVKLAITLRILSGGSYLDVSDIFNIEPKMCYKILHDTMKFWICNNNAMKIDVNDYLNDKTAMERNAVEFGKCSNNCLRNVIGALDGWLVKINCPKEKKEGIKSIGGYKSRKGFYALNVQVIVNKQKKVLWHCIKARGGAHDSTAFKHTELYKDLVERSKKLAEGDYFFVADSAYGIRSFLLTPYDNAPVGSKEDDFNYYLSRCRIYVECALGEIDMRWGIFWKKLSFDLKNTVNIIDGAIKLHNFIIDFRENSNKSSENSLENYDQFVNDCTDFCKLYPDEVIGTFGDGRNDERHAGRNEKGIELMRKYGMSFRESLCRRLKKNGLHRQQKIFYRNKNNHVMIFH